MKNKVSNIEILAPAGNFLALNAAVSAGANAVYLGLDHFNARRGADNFNLDNIKQACDYAHLRGVKIYLTLNIEIFDSEFKSAVNLAKAAADAGVDAFIVQDIGMALFVSQNIKGVPLHVSTQMNIHDESGIDAAAAIGAKRVTLARELSLAEIEKICNRAKEHGIEVETFGHGAICVCYSGQCLMSSMIGGRSANRGTCAQPCRLNYELKSGKWAEGQRRSDEDDKRGSYLLSTKDYCTIDILPKLMKAGVTSVKIEGRMKSPEYVYAVTNAYRSAADRLCDKDYFVSEADMKKLKEAFSRGFSTAYMENNRGNDMMSYQRPNNRGLNIGRVSFVNNKKLEVKVNCKLNIGDILEVWTKRGRTTVSVDGKTVIDNKLAKFSINPKDKSFWNVRAGDRVFRVRNAENDFKLDLSMPKIPVDCSAQFIIGNRAKIELSTGDFKAEVMGDVVEHARTRAIGKQDVIDHIDRMGSTPFEINSFDIFIDKNVGMGFSHIHHLRSQACDLLQSKILDFCSKENKTQEIVLPKIKSNIPADSSSDIEICAIATNPHTARAAKRCGASKIYVPKVNYKRGTASYQGMSTTDDSQTGYPGGIVLMEPVVYSKLDVDQNIAFCDNLSSVFQASSNSVPFEVGPHLPVVNRFSVDMLIKMGAKRIWLSPELSIGQIKDLTSNFKGFSFGLYILGTCELMVTKHCHLMSMGPCKQNCPTCERRMTQHYLLDRKGYEFPVVTDKTGVCHIYNSTRLDVCHAINDLAAAGINSFMVDTSLMSTEETSHAVGRAVTAASKGVEKIKNTTTGHLFKPVL